MLVEYSTCMIVNYQTLGAPDVKPGLLQTSLDIFYCLLHITPTSHLLGQPHGKVLNLGFLVQNLFLHLYGVSFFPLNNLFNGVFAHICEIRFAVKLRVGGGWVSRGLYRPALYPSGQIVFSHGNGSTTPPPPV